MKIATVIGKLEPKRAAPGFEEVKWIQVRVEKETVVAADMVDAAPGQLVLLATGAAAERCCMTCPADPIAVAVLEEQINKI